MLLMGMDRFVVCSSVVYMLKRREATESSTYTFEYPMLNGKPFNSNSTLFLKKKMPVVALKFPDDRI